MNTTVVKNEAGTWDTLTNGVERHTFKTRTAARSFAAKRDAQPLSMEEQAAERADQERIIAETRAADFAAGVGTMTNDELETAAVAEGLMRPKRQRRSAAERAQETWDAAAEQERENVAQKSTQSAPRGQECQWVGCSARSRTVRVLAGQRWSVCVEHSA